jgi:hypothetical protein
MRKRIFKCNISKNEIEYTCDIANKIVYFGETNIDPKLPKGFFLLLRTSIDEFIDKGYKRFVQTISPSEWETLLKKNEKWKLIEKHSEYYVIECDINDALFNISKGLEI